MGWRPKNWEEIKPQETAHIGIFYSEGFSAGVERGADAVLEALMFECAFEAVMSNARKEEEVAMSEQGLGKFWIVWMDGEGSFTFAGTKADAVIEVERLALQYPDKTIYLLEAIGSCEAKTIPEWESL